MSPRLRSVGLAPLRAGGGVALVAIGLAAAVSARAQDSETAMPAADEEMAAEESRPQLALAVLPFRVHASRGTQFGRPFAEMLGERLAGLEGVEVVGLAAAGDLPTAEAIAAWSDAELQALVRKVGAVAGVSGSLTELAGSFSLDVRVTPASETARSRSVVFTAGSIEELLLQLDEVAARVSASFSQGDEALLVAQIRLEAPPQLEQALRSMLVSRVGEPFDPQQLREDRERLQADPDVGSVAVETQRTEAGVVLRYRVVPTSFLLGGATVGQGAVVVEIRIAGNRRIEADAIRTRVRTRTGEPLRRSRVASDVREIFGLGFIGFVILVVMDNWLPSAFEWLIN